MNNNIMDLKVLNLLDEFENKLENLSAVPFTGKIMIDRDELLDIIREINILLPEEYQHVKWIKSQESQIVDEAQKKANTIILNAESEEQEIIQKARAEEERIEFEINEKMKILVDENIIVREANKKATEIIGDAEKLSESIKKNGYEYVEKLLKHFGASLSDVLNQIEENIEELDKYKE
ncbi:hypothetical protein [Helicovermis profundi]|uniref:Uncharacterized protein n=1 Tax=Helicovermis profundi TaxID=3065157 RepID=A0AAU9E4C9_9FIRM|nr:hypothetical protein HLPR_17850 [Clostridia bacterium S502]